MPTGNAYHYIIIAHDAKKFEKLLEDLSSSPDAPHNVLRQIRTVIVKDLSSEEKERLEAQGYNVVENVPIGLIC